jgi:predicted nuclease of predicted toxin-antitoxin system
MHILLDENVSPALATPLNRNGIPTQAVAYVGLSGADDPAVWAYAFSQNQVVVTLNAGDFLSLAAGVELHPGLIVRRVAGLSRSEQWAHIEPAIDYCMTEEMAGRSLVNRVIEIHGVGHANLEFYDLPTA